MAFVGAFYDFLCSCLAQQQYRVITIQDVEVAYYFYLCPPQNWFSFLFYIHKINDYTYIYTITVKLHKQRLHTDGQLIHMP